MQIESPIPYSEAQVKLSDKMNANRRNNIALFLDVDETLTKGIIQQHYADYFGYLDQFIEIETEFQKLSIDPREFNRRLLPLMRERGVTRQKCVDFSGQIPLQDWTPRLLTIDGVDVYLVSSGPNFYIDMLAERYGIPKDRVYCSEYEFEDNNGLIKEDAFGVSEVGKADFVKGVVGGYQFSIGMGDSAALDGPFISHCTIGFLTVQSNSYLFAPNFEVVISAIKSIQNTINKAEALRAPNADENISYDKREHDIEEIKLGDIVKFIRVKHIISIGGALLAAASGLFYFGTQIGSVVN